MAKKKKLPLFRVEIVHKIWGNLEVEAESMEAAKALVEARLAKGFSNQMYLQLQDSCNDSNTSVVGVAANDIGMYP